MEIICAKVLGFCMGVRRAVETASRALEENKSTGKKLWTLGPLIHNPLVLNELKSKGLNILESENLDPVDSNSVVVVRAHGATYETISHIEERNAQVLDATCPRVHLSQKRILEWSEKGYEIVLAGDRNHGEVVSISSYSKTPVYVIESSDEARELTIKEKTVLLAQTTFSPVEFDSIVNVLKEKNENLQVFNSICSATMERQNALRELEGKCDGIIAIGGKNSANTRRLYETALSICSNACLIEKVDEIPKEFYSLNAVGITAGASTPDSVIEEVKESLLGNK